MNRLLSICSLLALTLTTTTTTTTTVSAQATASTLHRLVNRATAIVEVKVLATRVDRQQMRHVVFKTLRSLKGSAPATFTLQEADHRMCGSALFGLIPGTGLLAFLDHGPTSTQLTMPSPRALLRLHAEVRDHVTALLRARSAKAKVRALTEALSVKHPRVRQDAAYALPLLRELGQAAGPDRERILTALHTALVTDDKSGASLIRTAQRLRLSSALDTLLPHYLDGKQPALDNMLLDVITDIDSDGAARRLSRAMPRRPDAQRRAVYLLARCGGATAKRCLQELLTVKAVGVQVPAAAALLDQGHSAADIRQRAGAEVLDRGSRLRARSRRLTFRSIRPRRDG